MIQLDPIDTIATKAFEGYVVRKDLVRKFKGQYPVPTYVAEFLLGRYCASVDDEEISDGLKIVERQLGEKTIRAGEHELFKARAKDKGQVKLIDIITARLDLFLVFRRPLGGVGNSAGSLLSASFGGELRSRLKAGCRPTGLRKNRNR